jgi:Heterokaryon incompatibility protein (HET)
MNKRIYISKGVTTHSNSFDGTVQQGQSFEGQLVKDSRTTSNRLQGFDERVGDAAAQCDIGGIEEEMLFLPTFTYHELMSQPGNIRLITLLPALCFWSPIRCSLFNTSIAGDNHLEYKALSYTWKKDGDSDDDDDELHAIILDGRVLYIGENLMEALRRLRHKTEPQIWWVDAICIDQMDNSDRSSKFSICDRCTKRQRRLLYGSEKKQT